MGFVGRMLINEKKDIPPSTRERLKKLWEFRFQTTIQQPMIYNDELNEFVDWLVSDIFDDEWAFGKMKTIFSKIGYPKDDYRFYKYLEDKIVAGTEILDCIKAMIENTESERLKQQLYMNRDKLKNILSKLYEEFKDNQEKKNDLEQIINKVGSLSPEYYSFGEILGYNI